MIEVKTFGSLRLLRDGVELEELPERLCLIFAALVAARGETVGVHGLVDLIWDERPPSSAVNQVHRHVGEIRRILEPGLEARAEGTIIQSRNEGYRLRSGSMVVDLDEFDSLVGRAHSAAAAGQSRPAIELLVDALALAPRPAFSGVAKLPADHPDFGYLETTRLATAMRLAEIALQARLHDAALVPLQRIAPQARLNEVLQARLIRLFTAAARAAEGIAHYVATAEHLCSELGMSPGPALRSAHLEAISASEASPSGRSGSPARSMVSFG